MSDTTSSWNISGPKLKQQAKCKFNQYKWQQQYPSYWDMRTIRFSFSIEKKPISSSPLNHVKSSHFCTLPHCWNRGYPHLNSLAHKKILHLWHHSTYSSLHKLLWWWEGKGNGTVVDTEALSGQLDASQPALRCVVLCGLVSQGNPQVQALLHYYGLQGLPDTSHATKPAAVCSNHIHTTVLYVQYSTL